MFFHSSTINIPAKFGPKADSVATPATCLKTKLSYVKWEM